MDAMESTGVYWKPVWNILEGQFTLVLANAQHVKNVPGRKTDTKDSEWLAEFTSAWAAGGKLRSATLDSGFAGFDAHASGSDAGIFPHCQSDSKGAGGRQYQAGQRSQRHAG